MSVNEQVAEMPSVLNVEVSGDGGNHKITTATIRLGQSGLDKCCERLDATVNQQRESTGKVSELKNKIEDIRRRSAASDNLMPRMTEEDLPDFRVQELKPVPEIQNELWGAQNGVDELVIAELEEERRRNDEYFMQLEQERRSNLNLQQEVESLRMRAENGAQENEKLVQLHEQNMKRVAFANQTRINELTEELEHLRKACGDRVKQVEIAAEKQKTEFIQLLTEIIELSQRGCWRDVQGHEINMQELLSDVLDGSGDINKDTVLMEAVRKFRNMRLSLDDENLQFIAQLKSTAEDNSEVEVNAELMMKYQSSMERVLELEKKLSDSNRKITMLETKLEEASDRLVKCQGSLWKLFYLTQGTELDQSGDKGSQSTEELKRIPAAEVVRVVGSVLHSKDIEIQQLSNRAESLQSHIEEWEAKLNTAENVKMQLEEQLKDLTKDLEERQAICDETRKQTRRLEDQLQNCENDKKMVEETRRHLEDEISNLQLQFQKLSTEGSRKIRDDAARATKAIEENYKQRLAAANKQIDVLQMGNRELKQKLSASSELHKELSGKLEAVQRDLREREEAFKHIEAKNQLLINELEEQKTCADTANVEFNRVSTELSQTQAALAAGEAAMAEVKERRNEAERIVEKLSHEIFEMKQEMDGERASRAELAKSVQCKEVEVNAYKAKVNQLELELVNVRQNSDELQMELTCERAKVQRIEEGSVASKKEIEKLLALRERFQKEKQVMIIAAREKEEELTGIKELLNKESLRLENIEKENEILRRNESTNSASEQQYLTRISLLQSEIDEAKNRLMEYEAKVMRFEEEKKRPVNLEVESEADKVEDDVGEASSVRSEGTRDSDIFMTFTQWTDFDAIRGRFEEVRNHWKASIEKLQDEKTGLSRRVEDLEVELKEAIATVGKRDSDLEAFLSKHEVEVTKLRSEVAHLREVHLIELEDVKEQLNKEYAALKSSEEIIRQKLAVTESELAVVKSQNSELVKLAEDWEEKFKAASDEISKMEEDMDIAASEMDKEVQRWKADALSAHSEVKALVAAKAMLEAELHTAEERCDALNMSNTDQMERANACLP